MSGDVVPLFVVPPVEPDRESLAAYFENLARRVRDGETNIDYGICIVRRPSGQIGWHRFGNPFGTVQAIGMLEWAKIELYNEANVVKEVEADD